MELTEKLSQLEDEIKVLKNEVQAVLLDLRESCLNFENPFNTQASPASSQTIAVNLQSPVNQPEPSNLHKITSKKTEPANTEPVEEDTPITDEPEQVTAREEVKRVERLAAETGIKSKGLLDSSNNRVDITTIAALTGWVNESTGRLGRERTEAVLDMSEVMGYLPPDLKAVLQKLISLAPEKQHEDVSTREYLSALIKLAGLLGVNNKSEVALLSILTEEEHHR